MNKKLPRDIGHQVDDLVITCIDHRFQHLYADELAQDGVERADWVSYQGSSKAVADGTLIPSIEISNRLHDIKNVWIYDHTDCGAFGGLEAFGSDENEEMRSHFESMERAVKAIEKVLPHLTVVTYIVDLDGKKHKPGTKAGPDR